MKTQFVIMIITEDMEDLSTKSIAVFIHLGTLESAKKIIDALAERLCWWQQIPNAIKTEYFIDGKKHQAIIQEAHYLEFDHEKHAAILNGKIATHRAVS